MYFKWVSSVGLTILGFSWVTQSDDQLPFLISSQGSLGEMRQALIKSDIIPDTLDDFRPSCYLRLYYASSKEQVWLGNKIDPAHAKKAPSIQILCPNEKPVEERKGFTVVLTDPDAPSRKDPKWSEICHWIGIVRVRDGGVIQEVYEIEDLVEYKPPGPPSKTGYHRYVFVLLQGNNQNLTAPTDREHWGTGKKRHGVRDWAKQEGLEIVGANFFRAKFKRQ